MNTGVGVQDKWLFAFNRIKKGRLMVWVRIALQLLSRVLVHTCKWHLHAYLLNELTYYITISFGDECIPQREMRIYLMLRATKEEADLFTLWANR